MKPTRHNKMIERLCERRSVHKHGFRAYLATQNPGWDIVWKDKFKVIPDAWGVHIYADGVHECVIYEVVDTHDVSEGKMMAYGQYADCHEFDCNFALKILNPDGVVLRSFDQRELEPYAFGLEFGDFFQP